MLAVGTTGMGRLPDECLTLVQARVVLSSFVRGSWSAPRCLCEVPAGQGFSALNTILVKGHCGSSNLKFRAVVACKKMLFQKEYRSGSRTTLV